ncbi:hypothetical protein QN277_010439 [Acacia crassicarpa]|uniref:Disease resistance RPP13-like protein 1 n=2 Tax=Acacia crassicarpa TaxID=499986 RepID=A0AAE1IMW6_9FABA|nr:hypothetical protein QN277_010439 [Acacia crassicarpa]
MAAELVGGSFLSAALEVAFKRLASSDLTNYFQSRKLKDTLLKKLQITLISLNQVLDDTEAKQYTKPNVKKWLHELKHAVYLADDLLDEIVTEATRLKIEAQNQTATSKVLGLFTGFINPFDKQIESRVQQLLDDLEFLVKQKDVLGLKEGSGSGSGVGLLGKVLNRLPTTSLVADESSIYGRDGDKEKIIELLLDEDLSGNPLSVISIVGMGGLGKTTLAQLVYNNARVENHFQLKAWVCISEEFDVVRVTRTIVSALGCFITGYEDLNQLQMILKEKLAGKKLLLVLDDIWNESQSDWEAMQVPFLFGTLGSKIIVTTRSEKVALVVGSSRVYQMALLNEEDGWKLFAEYAFRNKDDRMWTNLESIGKKTVEKCKGLPLAIKTLGGLLHTKSSEKQWNEILNSEIWQLPDDESDIMPALRLSYHYLSSNLKRCFAFCSIFPKDFEIEKDPLIHMWMAEDLLHFNQGNKNVEEMGSQILDELESRSFLQKSTIHNRYIMHDLVNDLAKSISEEFCQRIEGGKVQYIHEKIRYLSYSASPDSSEILLERFHECKQLRCFVSLTRGLPFSIKEDKDVGEMLSKFKYLRILSLRSVETTTKLGVRMNNSKHLRYLDLSDTRIEKLPGSTCRMYNLQTLKLCGCTQFVELPPDLDKLTNLHHLDLSKTKISRLPCSLCKLPNLQTLKLQACQSLVELPPGLHNLINLQHLDISWTSIREMPNNMGRLKHLQILTSFYVGKHNGSNLEELGKLVNLRGSLEISKLENINDPTYAREAYMNNKKYLYKLDLRWSGNNEDSQNERFTLEGLQPHVNLKELAIRNYGGTRFADWFGAPYLPNLVSVVLRACKYCFCLPPLGQLPSLKSVHISKLEGIKKIGLEFYGNNNLSCVPFPSLENLFIAEMLEWEEWMHLQGECFPCLKEIVIRNCPRLRKSLPPCLPCLEKLEIEQCGDLELESFPTKSFNTPKLESIYLSGLPHLKSLHEEMHTLLPYVQSLFLSRCSQLQSIPQNGLPLSLVQVQMHDCPKLITSRMNWGLHRLHSLQDFSIGENFENTESFPEEGLLPPNLKILRFVGCSNLVKLNGSGLLPLTSLQCLIIHNCPNLQCLPEGSLPRSLSYLIINGNCPFLRQQYQKNGQERHTTSHIPWVCIS